VYRVTPGELTVEMVQYWKEDKFAAPPLPDTLQSAYYLEFTHLAHMQVFNTSGMEQDHFNQWQVWGYQ
jgi:hypothetical protein